MCLHFPDLKIRERISGNRCQIEGSNQAIILAAWFIALAFCLLAMSPSPAPAEIVARGHLLTHLPPGDADRTRQLGLPQHLTSCRLLPPAEFGFVPCFRLSPSSTPYLSLFIWKLSSLCQIFPHQPNYWTSHVPRSTALPVWATQQAVCVKFISP